MRRISSTVLCLILAPGACSSPDLEQRQAEVADVGSGVMPFDLDRTTHFFEKADYGGLQTVLSTDHDPEQVALIREHLTDEAARFASGDFHDPEMIHGNDMPGLHTLITGHERLSLNYRDVENGAELRYESEDPALIEAIHDWFDAQLRDHGDHARAHR